MPIDPRHPPPTDPQSRIWSLFRELDRRLSTIESYFNGGATQQFPVVDVLPSAGRLGRAVVLSTDKKLYVDNGTTWIAQT